tara:strand:- start:272 stop:2086 length:1815 start_codon:yes stop_codon:yes gene_type:complete
MNFHVITRCTRLSNLYNIKESIYQDGVNVNWHIIFDTSVLTNIDFELLNFLSKCDYCFLHYIKGQSGDYLYPQSMEIVKEIKNGYIIYVDDDTIVHSDYYKELSSSIKENEDKKVFVVDQFVDKKDFTNLEYRIASPEHTKYQHIDLAQITFHHSVFDEYEFIGNYSADGLLVEKIHKDHPNWFVYINKTLSYYNYLTKNSQARLPKILFIGEREPVLKTSHSQEFETDELITKYVTSDKNIQNVIHEYKPDCILTISNDDVSDFPNLCSLSSEFRKKWYNIENQCENIGDIAYNVAMENILNYDNTDLISWVTSMYNTGEMLYRTYDSLKNQTNINWEWVLANDSSDQQTIRIANEIASKDSRVRVYDFSPKSGGIIGEAKYRAMAMARGFILAEFDHDDYLTPNATQMLYDASKAYPDAGFYYTDSCEVDSNWNSLKYDLPFAFGYGKYYKEIVIGKEFDVADSPNINPKTIRHIVGVPNHVRAWRRNIYFEIGCQNRGLSIADDYELVVRTFLKTKMCGIKKLGYIQFMHDGTSATNTQDISRGDIQRRVKTIMYNYNEKIQERFKELGVDDWAYNENPDDPLSVESRYGESEGYVNYTFT